MEARARPGGLFEQAALLFSKGQIAEAERIYRTLLAADKSNVACLFNLGTICARAGRLDEAASLLRRAVKAEPTLAAAHLNLGNVTREQGRTGEAIRHFENAARLAPNSAEAENNLATALKSLGRRAEAARHFEAAIALKPGYADAHGNFANLLLEIGQLDEAAAHYEAAIALVPANGRYFRGLGTIRRFTAGDPLLGSMRAAAEQIDTLSLPEQIELHFALGKALGDAGDHKAAFRHLAEGNALERKRVAYDEAAGLALFDRIRTVFTGGTIAARRGAGAPSNRPIFIVGMPRSGSTLVEQMLGALPGVFAAGEIDDFAAEFAKLNGPDGRARYPDDIPTLTDRAIRGLGERYLARTGAQAPQAVRIVDKALGNFHFLGLIHMALPGAKIVHVRRDPVDTCFSCFAQLFTDMHPSSYDQRELGRYYRAYRALIEHWRRALPAGVMIDLDYERLVAGPAGEMRRVLAHCGLDWDPACLDFHRARRPVRTASAAQVRRPISAGAIGASAPYRPWLGPLIAALEGR